MGGRLRGRFFFVSIVDRAGGQAGRGPLWHKSDKLGQTRSLMWPSLSESVHGRRHGCVARCGSGPLQVPLSGVYIHLHSYIWMAITGRATVMARLIQGMTVHCVTFARSWSYSQNLIRPRLVLLYRKEWSRSLRVVLLKDSILKISDVPGSAKTPGRVRLARRPRAPNKRLRRSHLHPLGFPLFV